MRADRSARHFRLGLFLYALVLILICGAVLLFLQRYLVVYEHTRPAAALEVYRAALLSENATEGFRAALDDLDPQLRSPEESLRLARDLLEGLQFSESIADSSEQEKCYRVLAGGQKLGELRLRTAGEEAYGLSGWECASEQYDLSAFFHGVSATVPPDYRVFVGEHVLGNAELKEKNVPYASLADAYPLLEGLPFMQRYESGLFIGELPLRVLDASGRELSPAQQNEEHYLDNCQPEDRNRIDAYVESFLKPYILFTANIDQEIDRYYDQLLPLTLPGSALRQRLNEGKNSAWWSWVRSCELQEREITACTDLGDGRFLVDLVYTTKVVAIADPVIESYSLRMVLDDTTGKLLGSFLYNR